MSTSSDIVGATWKAIFLNIDCSLINKRSNTIGGGVVDSLCVKRLNVIISQSQPVVLVITGPWKIARSTAEIRQMLHVWGVESKNIDRTESNLAILNKREKEIKTWLAANPCEKYIIIDHEANLGSLTDNYIKTDFAEGLSREQTEKAISMLK